MGENVLALSGLTAVEVGSLVAGPALGSLLRMLGARVIKVEPPKVGDPSRTVSPWGFLNYNLGKESVTIDLKQKEGQSVLRKLVSRSNIFIENLAPGASDRLGISYSKLREVNPELIYVSIKGFSADSSLADKPAFDAVAQAMSGTMSLTGDGNPVRIGNPSVDLGAAAYALIGILSQLLIVKRNQNSEAGTFIEVSLLDMSVYWNGYWLSYYGITGKIPRQLGSGHPGYCPHRVFKTKDEKFVFVATLSDEQWKKLRELLKLDVSDEFDTSQNRLTNRDLIEGVVAIAISRLRLQEVLDILGDRVPAAALKEIPEVYSSQDLSQRRILFDVDYSSKKVKVTKPPVGALHKSLNDMAVPQLGADSHRVLLELGYSDTEIDGLRSSGTI